MAVLAVGGVVLAVDTTAAGAAATDKTATKGTKHVDLDKQLADLQAKKDALVKADAKADTKEIDAKIDEVKAKIAKKAAKKSKKAKDAADTTTAAPAPAAQ